jgi:hypothetical protein
MGRTFSRFFQGLGLAVMVVTGPSVHAEPVPPPEGGSNGKLNWIFDLDTQLNWTDNLFRSEEEEFETWGTVISPALQTWIQNGTNSVSVTLRAKNFTYASSHDDDATDYIANLDIHHEFNARNTLNFFAEFNDTHEARGTGVSEGIALRFEEPVELERAIVGGDYTFGSRESAGRLKLSAKGVNHNYQNFREFTQYRDRDEQHAAGTFYWKVGGRTDLLAEVRYYETEYDVTNPLDAAGTLDSENYEYFLGVEWEATGKTKGAIRLGAQDRKYSSSLREDDDGFNWDIDITYSPRTYSHIQFMSGSYYQETNGLGDAINRADSSLGWDHAWSSRTRSHIKGAYIVDEYDGVDREDDIYKIEAEIIHVLNRYLEMGFGYRYADKDSDIDFFDYTRNEVFLNLDLKFNQ